jgi:hypothetical protein
MVRHREEVLNVYLAECLCDAGMRAEGEQIEMRRGERAMPDVLVSYMGLRCIIEGKFGDSPSAKAQVQSDASKRVRDGISHIALGVVYPPELRSRQQSELKAALREAQFEFCLCVETNYSSPEWHSGVLNDILNILRHGHSTLLQDDVLARSVASLRYGMEDLVRLLDANPASAIRVAEIVGVSPEPETDEEEEADDA